MARPSLLAGGPRTDVRAAEPLRLLPLTSAGPLCRAAIALATDALARRMLAAAIDALPGRRVSESAHLH